jgi:CheY-like chemotaxis protein
MVGDEAKRRIKTDSALRLIPIFAVTSYALSGVEQNMFRRPTARASC